MKPSLISLLGLLLFISSCHGQANEENQEAKSYTLAIVDSVQVDLYSSGLIITDVNVENGQLLGIQSDPPVAYLLTGDGEVLKKHELPTEGPNGVGSYLLCGSFYEDGIALMGRVKVNTFDIDFNLRKTIRSTYKPFSMVYLGSNHLFELEQPGNNLLVSYFGGPQTELRKHVPEYYEAFNLLDVLDPHLLDSRTRLELEAEKTELFKPIGRLEPDSRFKKGKAFYFLRVMFDVKDQKLIYSMRQDTTLYERALPSGEVLSAQTIPFDKFILFQGYSMGIKGYDEQSQSRDRSGKIRNLFRTGDFTVITYTSGMKRTEMEALGKGTAGYDERIERADYFKYLILKDGKRVNPDLRMTDKISYFDMADEAGYIWAHQNLELLEEEPDLITFYKMKVVPVTE